jgi:hypothetical protein
LDRYQKLERTRFLTERMKFLEVNVEISACEYIYKEQNIDSLRQFAILRMGEFGFWNDNSYATVDRSKEGDNLSLFLAFWK